MSLTYSLDHVNASTESVLVEVAAKSEMVLQSTDVDPKTGEAVAIYVLASGDNAYPATVTYRTQLQNRASGPVRRLSVTFQTWAVVANSVSGIDTRKPISHTTSILLPADVSVELADIDDLIGNGFSFLFASQASGARDTAYLSKLLYGSPKVV